MTKKNPAEAVNKVAGLVSEMRQEKKEMDSVFLQESVVNELDKFVEMEVTKSKETKKAYDKQCAEYLSASSKVKDKQFVQKLQIGKLYTVKSFPLLVFSFTDFKIILQTTCERRKQHNLYKNALFSAKSEFTDVKAKQEFDIFDIFSKCFEQNENKSEKEHKRMQGLQETISTYKEWIALVSEKIASFYLCN